MHTQTKKTVSSAVFLPLIHIRLKTSPDSLHKSASYSFHPDPRRLKRCIIPNICILISSVTLTRTPVNKAINQTSVGRGGGGVGWVSEERCVCALGACLIRMNLFTYSRYKHPRGSCELSFSTDADSKDVLFCHFSLRCIFANKYEYSYRNICMLV